MGVRGALLFGCVLLMSGGDLCAASRNASTNATLSPIQKEPVATGLPPPPPRSTPTSAVQSSRPQKSEPVRFPVGYRLRSFQLREPDHRPAHLRPAEPIPELPEPSGSVGAGEPERLLPGPNLSLPLKHQAEVAFERRAAPAPADSVAVRCGEGKVTVEVKRNLLGNGQLIRPSDLTLGGCAALDAADHVLVFRSELQGCGSTSKMTADALVYTFSLIYSPTPVGDTSVFKTSPAEVAIECHYPRRRHVSSGAARPAWQPFAADARAERQLRFSLRLMTEDWRSPRPSGVYSLGDVMRVEASVVQGHHVPLRVFVDACVATVTPDAASLPSYAFVGNHGCLSDAKLTGAKSYFMQRSREDKLHFQLKAFRFHQDHRNSLYITCRLRATPLSVPVDSRHKACSFLAEANRWVASGGDNKVCSCCESSCSDQRRRRRRSLGEDAVEGLLPASQWDGVAALGPILLERAVLHQELTQVPELPLATPTGTPAGTPTAPFSLLAAACGAALAAALLAVTAAVVCGRANKPGGKVPARF